MARGQFKTRTVIYEFANKIGIDVEKLFKELDKHKIQFSFILYNTKDETITVVGKDNKDTFTLLRKDLLWKQY